MISSPHQHLLLTIGGKDLKFSFRIKIKPIIFAAALMLPVSPGVAVANVPQGKMTPEEVVTRHLAAIGTPEARAAAKSRVMTGENHSRLKSSIRLLEVVGAAQIASEGNKVLLAMTYNANNYPYDKAAYDGEKFTVAGLPEGGRSPLTNFLVAQDVIFKHGLIGGVLSSAWTLANLDPEKGKLSYSGREKLDGREVHKLKYIPKKGDVKINLYFDAETFQHLRSDYEYLISARMGARPGTSVTQGTNPTGDTVRYRLIEEYSDFKKAGNLTLPHAYKIQYVSETQTFEYNIRFLQVDFNQTIAPEAFRVSSAN